MTSARDDLTKSEAILVAAIEGNVQDLVVARETIMEFQSMIRSKAAAKLERGSKLEREPLLDHSPMVLRKIVPPSEMRSSRPGPMDRRRDRSLV